MSGNKVVVIGAGLSGLSTGIYLRMHGYGVRILEHGRHAGGVASYWKRRGYNIDGGIHFHTACGPGQSVRHLYEELGIARDGKYRQTDLYSRFQDAETGSLLDVTSDLDQLARDMAAQALQDKKFIKRFIADVKGMRGLPFDLGMAKPLELSTWRDGPSMFLRHGFKLRFFSGRFNRSVAETVQEMENPWLREVFRHLFLPEVPLWFAMYMLSAVSQGAVWLRLDGCAGFVADLVERYLSLGGEITFQARAEKILVESDRATGVRVRHAQSVESEDIPADIVVSAADGASTIFELLDGKYTDNAIRQRYKEWPLFEPYVMATFGVDRDLAHIPWSVILKAGRDFSRGHLRGDWMSLRNFHYAPEASPPGKGLIQVMCDSSWEPWQELRDDPEAYKAEKEAAAAEMLDRLDAFEPGLAASVDMIDVATPHTLHRYTLNQRGAWEGFLPTPQALRVRIPKTLPGLDNFYMAGQWTSAGGGVLPCLYSGRHIAQILCRSTGQPFAPRRA